MNKKLTIGIVGAIAVAAFAIAGIRFASMQAQADAAPAAAVTPVNGAPTGQTFSLGTTQGVVTINNVYLIPFIIDGEYLIIKDNGSYQINYNTETSQFDLYFYATPAASDVTTGEADLTTMLGVSHTDACKLNVLEEYPGSENPVDVGNQLSFCAATSTFGG